jgi:HSP20 family protein
MALVRWDPTREVDSLQSEVNRVFDVFFGNGAGQGTRARRWVPAMDLVETEEHLVLRADLPGLSEEDVALEIKDGVLTLSGERKAEHEEKSEGFYRVERSFGGFSRSLTLPQGIDAEQVAAEFNNGVLEVRIPKPAERKPHRVAIGAAANGGDRNVNGTAEEK